MSRRIGKGPCPNCGAEVTYKVNQKEHLYAYCHHPADGGCGSGTTSRSDKGDELLARKVVKWDSAEERKKWLPDSSEQPEQEPAELDEELGEAEEAGEVVTEPVAEPEPPPAPRPRRTVPPPAPRQPTARPKPPARRSPAPPARRSLVDDLL